MATFTKELVLKRLMANMLSDEEVHADAPNNGMEFSWLKKLYEKEIVTNIVGDDGEHIDKWMSEVKLAAQMYVYSHCYHHQTERGSSRFNYAMAILTVIDPDLAMKTGVKASQDIKDYETNGGVFPTDLSDDEMKVKLGRIKSLYVNKAIQGVIMDKGGEIDDVNYDYDAINNEFKKGNIEIDTADFPSKEKTNVSFHSSEDDERSDDGGLSFDDDDDNVKDKNAKEDNDVSREDSMGDISLNYQEIEFLNENGIEHNENEFNSMDLEFGNAKDLYDTLTGTLDHWYQINSKEYKDVIAVVADVEKIKSHKIEMTEENLQMFKDHMADVAKTYLDSHITDRWTTQGKQRFEAVLAVLDMTGIDAAADYLKSKGIYDELHGKDLESTYKNLKSQLRVTERKLGETTSKSKRAALETEKKAVNARLNSMKDRTEKLSSNEYYTTENLKSELIRIRDKMYSMSMFESLEPVEIARQKVCRTLLDSCNGEYKLFNKKSVNKAFRDIQNIVAKAQKKGEIHNPQEMDRYIDETVSKSADLQTEKDKSLSEKEAGMGKVEKPQEKQNNQLDEIKLN